MKLALISASWHSDLVNIAISSCREELRKQGVDLETQVDNFIAPGSLELPLLAQKLAQTKKYAGVIAFGLVVDGGIYRHEFVAQAVIDGFMRVQLDTGIPIFSVVLTPQSFHEHDAHHDFFKKHLALKGTEATTAALDFIRILGSIERR